MRDIDELRPLSLSRLLELWRQCREYADPLEQVLLCNGRVLAESCFYQGGPVYGDGAEALEDLTGRQMERLLWKLAEGGGDRRPPAGRETVNPAFDTARFDALRGEN